MKNEITLIYPMITSIGSIALGLLSLFGTLLPSECEFKQKVNWCLAKLRGKKVDKLTKFVVHFSNIKNSTEDSESDNSFEDNIQRISYLEDPFQNFIDKMQKCINLELELEKKSSIYLKLNNFFVFNIILSIILVILSLIFNHYSLDDNFFFVLFVFALVIIFLHIIIVLILRYFSNKVDDICSDSIFDEHR